MYGSVVAMPNLVGSLMHYLFGISPTNRIPLLAACQMRGKSYTDTDYAGRSIAANAHATRTLPLSGFLVLRT
jgi:hypothetical protein